MRYADYYDCDICNGNAVGMSLFVQGCPLHCDGCFNPETWNFEGGKEWTAETKQKFIELAGRNYIQRISILGGSPLCDENVVEVFHLVRELKAKYPMKEIWVYTGYTWETIWSKVTTDDLYSYVYKEARQDTVKLCDVLVDGPFEYDKKDLSLAFRGSSNQRIIDVQRSLREGRVILWKLEI